MLKVIFTLLLFTTDTLYVFYSPDCPHCTRVITQIEQLQKRIPVKLLNIQEDSVIGLLDSIENTMNIHGDELPVLLYRKKLYYGFLPEFLTSAQPNSTELPLQSGECRDCTWLKEKAPDTISGIYFVYTPGCKKCSRFAIELEKLKNQYHLNINEVSSFDSMGLIIVRALKEKSLYKKVPLLLIGDTVLYTLPGDRDNFVEIIKKHAGKSLNTGPITLKEKMNITTLTTVVAGLLDGINPCAFTVFLFLIAFLSYKRKSKKESIIVLLLFSSGIFIAYFSIGIGLFWLLELVNRIRIINTIVKVIIGLFALTLGFFSLKDGIYLLHGKREKSGGLSLKDKQKTHTIIRKYIDKGLFAGSLLMGFSVSLVEFACTGQIYLPTLSYISKNTGLSITRLFFLLLYNICFLIPLIVIGLLAIFIEQGIVAKKLRRDTPYIKFATALLFFGLGILIIFF